MYVCTYIRLTLSPLLLTHMLGRIPHGTCTILVTPIGKGAIFTGGMALYTLSVLFLPSFNFVLRI